MSTVTPQMIKQLRERTGVGMAKCKEALEEAGGDLDKAIENLRKAGMASAVKREGREANEGVIGIGESADAFSFIEVNSETDFVAQNDKFKAFVKDLAHLVASEKPKSLEAFLALTSPEDPSLTIDQLRALFVQSLGENIQIKRITLLHKGSDKSIGVYSHMGGKIVTAVVLSGGAGNEVLARDIAMHVAAESPEYLHPEDVPNDKLEVEKDIARTQVKGKPENIIDKIVEGKIKAFYDQVCLICQKYVKDNSLTITQLLEQQSKGASGPIGLTQFFRWEVGE